MVSFELSEEQRLLRESVAAVAIEQMRPAARVDFAARGPARHAQNPSFAAFIAHRRSTASGSR